MRLRFFEMKVNTWPICKWNYCALKIYDLYLLSGILSRLHCTFIDTSLNFYHHRKSQHQNYIYNILNNLIECVRLSEHKMEDPYHHDNPDIRIILCMFCGDPFSVESILSPIMSEPSCCFSGDRSVIFETFLGDTKKKIEVIVSSYHGANAFRDELVHGFILLFSTKRRASLATLK